MNDTKERKTEGFFVISIIFILLSLFFGHDLADHLKGFGFSASKIYILFMLIFLPFASLIWAFAYGLKIKLSTKEDLIAPIVGSPGWLLNFFIIPEKISIRILSAIFTAIVTVMGLKLGVLIKKYRR